MAISCQLSISCKWNENIIYREHFCVEFFAWCWVFTTRRQQRQEWTETNREICWNLCIFYVLPSKANVTRIRHVAQVLKGVFREKCVFPILAFNAFFFLPAKAMSSAWANMSHILLEIPISNNWRNVGDWSLSIIVVCLVLNKKSQPATLEAQDKHSSFKGRKRKGFGKKQRQHFKQSQVPRHSLSETAVLSEKESGG